MGLSTEDILEEVSLKPCQPQGCSVSSSYPKSQLSGCGGTDPGTAQRSQVQG